MKAIHCLWCGIVFCLPGWQPCRGAEEGKMEEKVGIVFREAGLKRDTGNDGGEGVLQWKCSAVLFIREPWGFGESSVVENQSLGRWAADGRELAPVEFQTAWLNENSRKGVSFTVIEGTAANLPPAGCAWIRLKGCLRVPVARTLESPVYELPLRQGAAAFIPLPGIEEENGGNVNDVVEPCELPVGILYVKKCERVTEDGKKQLMLSICLDANNAFRPEKFQLLDENGKVLEYQSLDNSEIDDESTTWTADFTFSPPEKMNADKCRVRLVYKTALKYVSVPVDARFGIGGEIREEAEKRGGKKAG